MPYSDYDRHAPIGDAMLRSVKTPEPQDISGMEWKQLFSQWMIDLRDRMKRPDFEYTIMVNTKSHKKGWESSQRPVTPIRNNFATYNDYENALQAFVSDIKRLHNEAIEASKVQAIAPKLPNPVPNGSGAKDSNEWQ